MFTNLHTLPTGQSMYTVAITDDPKDTPDAELMYEELDVVGGSRLTAREVAELAEPQVEEIYGPSVRVIGVVDQSSGYVMHQDAETDLRPGR